MAGPVRAIMSAGDNVYRVAGSQPVSRGVGGDSGGDSGGDRPSSETRKGEQPRDGCLTSRQDGGREGAAPSLHLSVPQAPHLPNGHTH